MAVAGELFDPNAENTLRSRELTSDELDELAAAFRPMWELDDAPFTGPGSLAAPDIADLQNAAYENERARALISSDRQPFHAGKFGQTGPAAGARSVIVPGPVSTPPVAPVPRRASLPSPRPRLPSLEFDVPDVERRSRKPLWIALAAAAVVLVAVGAWAASSSAPQTSPTAGPTSATPAIALSPPVASGMAGLPAVPAPDASDTAREPAQGTPANPLAAPPPALPTAANSSSPTLAPAAAPRRTEPTPPPKAVNRPPPPPSRPVTRTKAAGTNSNIVRDVPF